MQRKQFLVNTLLAAPLLAFSNFKNFNFGDAPSKGFIVKDGASRFGEDVKFLGVHPNNLKISSKDTNGQLSVFEYIGLGKVGPTLHVHFDQDEIFNIVEGEYKFVVGEETHYLKPGETIFLPRKVPHTWIQLTEKGKMIYFLQPAGKMEEFFTLMNGLKTRPSELEMDKIHAAHGMKVVGPPLSL